MAFVFRAMDEGAAVEVLEWQYASPYDLYNFNPARRAEDLAYLIDPINQFYAIYRTGDGSEAAKCTPNAEALVAFCSFGADAQVPGGDYSAPALDIGLGVRPDLTGQGQGLTYVAAVIAFACRVYAPDTLRVTIAAFNRRAQRVWQKAGFVAVATFDRAGLGDVRMAFVVMTRSL